MPAGSGPVGWRNVAAEVALVMAVYAAGRPRAVHPLEGQQMAAVVDHGDIDLQIHGCRFRLRAGQDASARRPRSAELGLGRPAPR